jgi:brefeldin A-inhibited guanine nucleotide-exchange protein
MPITQWSKIRYLFVARRFFYINSLKTILLYCLMQMSLEDFIRNNRGIDDGKDLPEEFMGSLYERIWKKEIKMKEDEFVPHQQQSTSSNKILGLDNILNIVVRKRGACMETSDDLIRHMQEQFKEMARMSE